MPKAVISAKPVARQRKKVPRQHNQVPLGSMLLRFAAVEIVVFAFVLMTVSG